VLKLAVAWLSSLCTVVLLAFVVPWPLRASVTLLYFVASAQVYWFARQIGTFGVITALLFPVPLFFFFGLFTVSLTNRMLRRQVSWRGRQV